MAEWIALHFVLKAINQREQLFKFYMSSTQHVHYVRVRKRVRS